MGGAPLGFVSATHARWLAAAPDRRWRTVDATLVFADVSGFTAMSEKLARRGKIGAEETTVAVNQVFGVLLGATRASAGEILKFGGDAVLACFEGEAHAARGATCALAMQAAMRPLRRFRTAAGTVGLRLSAGVASGTAHLFLAGSKPRELVVAGPLASEVVCCESGPPAGPGLASAGTLAALPGRCAGAGGLLRRAPPVPDLEIPEPPPGFDPRPALPLHLHDHEPGDGEHRFASVAFVQFKGADRLATEDPGRLAHVLDEVVAGATEACLAYGVTFVSTDVDRDGGKIVLAAGAPTASPDDEDRLLHALRSIVAREWPVPVRAGANRGRVFMVDIGPPERRAWSVMGDAVNLAARVMARAEPGQVLATPAVLDRVRDEFERVPVEPFMVKGKSAPVHADAVGPARGARRAAGARAAPLVGRDRELAVLREALAEARAGERRVVQLVGEPGLGKSRLVEAAVQEAQGLAVVGVAGGPYAVHSPYRALRAPLRELLGVSADAAQAGVEAELRALAGALDPRLLPWLPLVAIPFGLELEPTPQTAALSPEFARARLNAVLGSFVQILLPARGALLVIEDAHWLDEASSDFLGFLLGRLRPGRGRLVLVTRRDVAGGLSLEGRPETTTLHLEPLDAGAALELVQEEVGDAALPPGAFATLVERAGGNPLLLGELVAAARAGEPLDALPDSVEALVTARIDTLPPADRHILRQAAVLGMRVPVDVLESVLGADAFEVSAALRRLDDFLVADGRDTVRFRHALLRDAAYEALPFRRRRDLHGRAGELIERRAGAAAERQAELLAIHYHAAAEWARSWHYARVAARHALDRAAPVEAAGFHARALEAGRALRVDPMELAAVSEERGDACRLAGRLDEASAAYQQARRWARGHPLRDAGLCLKVGRLRERSKHRAQALGWYTRGERLLDDSPPTRSLRAQLVLARGVVRLHAGRILEAVPHLERAAALARESGDQATLANAYTVLDWAHTELGTPDQHRYRALALPIYEKLGDYQGQAKTLNNHGIGAYYEGRWDEAVALYERSRLAYERIGDVVEAAITVNNMAEIRSDQGRFDEAEQGFRDALATWRASGFTMGVGLACSNLGRVASRRGDAAGASRLFAQARETLTAIGADVLLLELDAREAEGLVLAGEPAAALELAGTVRASSKRVSAQPAVLALVQRVVGLAELQSGDPEAARMRFGESLAMAREAKSAYEEALALEALGYTGDEEAGRQAVEILERLGVVALPRVPALSRP